ncbi:MAG: hypothetical protein ABR574_08905 [Cryomorphaceae bacterium]
MESIAHFQKLDLNRRLKYVEERGQYVKSRNFGSFDVHLYALNGFYCEVWMRKGLNQVNWIEVADIANIAETYLLSLDVKKSFGL